MTDSPAYIKARAIIRERAARVIRLYGPNNESRTAELHLTLQAYFNADLSAPILDEVLALLDDLRRAHDGDTEIIGATHRDPDYTQYLEEAIDTIEDCVAAKIRELITDTLLGEYASKELAA